MKLFNNKIGFVLSLAFATMVPLKTFSQTITTIAGNGVFGYSGDGGQATSAEMTYPRGLAVDTLGNVYFADENNNRIRQINGLSEVISTIAGNGLAGFAGDGGSATNAKLYFASAVALDSAGNLYIGDNDNNRVRKVSKSSGIIATITGNGTPGFSGDGGAAQFAEVNQPSGLAIDDSNNIFISDTYNNRVREINGKTGMITTVAGNGIAGFSGDGGMATAASIRFAIGIAVDNKGDLFIADTQNSRIRKVDLVSGVITTIAGDSVAGYSGDGGQASSAELNYPFGVATDVAGNIYVADTHNNSIRRIDAASGIINTIAGNGVQGFSGDGGAATLAELNFPVSVVADKYGNVYVSDEDNYRIRKISGPLGINEAINGNNVIVYPCPTKDAVHLITGFKGVASVSILDAVGREYYSATINNLCTDYAFNTSTLPDGLYIMQINTQKGFIAKRFIVER